MAMSARPLGWIEMSVTGQGASVQCHRLYPVTVFGRNQNLTDGLASLSHDPNDPEDMAAYHLCLSQC